MDRRGILLVALNVPALVFLYFVLQDFAWRSSYVKSEHLTPSVTYSLFTNTFNIAGSSVQFPLVSPPTLDWVQVLIGLLLVCNFAFILSWRASRTP